MASAPTSMSGAATWADSSGRKSEIHTHRLACGPSAAGRARFALQDGPRLLDDTLVLVMSELGRSRASRGSNGTDSRRGHGPPEGVGVHLR